MAGSLAPGEAGSSLRLQCSHPVGRSPFTPPLSLHMRQTHPERAGESGPSSRAQGQPRGKPGGPQQQLTHPPRSAGFGNAQTGSSCAFFRFLSGHELLRERRAAPGCSGSILVSLTSLLASFPSLNTQHAYPEPAPCSCVRGPPPRHTRQSSCSGGALAPAG